MFKLNATKLQACKLVASLLPNSLYLWDSESDYYSVQAALQTKHVIIDFASNVDSTLGAKWMYHKSFIRLGNLNFVGSSPNEFCRMLLHVLAPVKVGSAASTPTVVYITPFVRFTKHSFAGMAYEKVPSNQMLSSVRSGVTTFRKAVEITEYALDSLDQLANSDKPTDLFSKVVTIPASRLSFAHGRPEGRLYAHAFGSKCINNVYVVYTFTLWIFGNAEYKSISTNMDASIFGNPITYAFGLFKQLLRPSTWSVLTHATRFF